jgi:hypothetical protein
MLDSHAPKMPLMTHQSPNDNHEAQLVAQLLVRPVLAPALTHSSQHYCITSHRPSVLDSSAWTWTPAATVAGEAQRQRL